LFELLLVELAIFYVLKR